MGWNYLGLINVSPIYWCVELPIAYDIVKNIVSIKANLLQCNNTETWNILPYLLYHLHTWVVIAARKNTFARKAMRTQKVNNNWTHYCEKKTVKYRWGDRIHFPSKHTSDMHDSVAMLQHISEEAFRVPTTVYFKKYAHGFVVLCFVVVMQSFIMNSHEVFIHIHQGCFAGTGAIVRLLQCQWSKPDGYGKISQCKTNQ